MALSGTKIDGHNEMPHRVVIGPVVPPSHHDRQVLAPNAIDLEACRLKEAHHHATSVSVGSVGV